MSPAAQVQLREVAVTLAVAAAVVLVVAVPTDLIDTPWFSRDIAPTVWAWPALLAAGVLSGLLAATYVDPARQPPASGEDRRGAIAGLLTFFAVGCPVCNKLVLVALGYSGAIAWFQPVQPVLQALALGLLTWALVRRWRGRRSCPAVPMGAELAPAAPRDSKEPA